MGVLMRALLFGLVVLFVVRAAKRFLLPHTPQAPDAAQASPKRASIAAQNMVECAQCGLHVPEQDAALRAGKYYCRDHA